ncbi:MAG: hypothetical protein V3W18_06910 [candidate division Zixibacteria bacterium]
MNKKVLLIVFAVLFAFMALLACSDNATDPAKTEGDPEDPNYIQAKAMTEAYVDSLFYTFNVASGYITFNGDGPLNTTGDTLNISFDEETCWWEIYAGSDSIEYSFLLIDSVKFQDVEGCQMFPDSTTTTSIEYRMILDLNLEADSGYINMAFDQSVLLAGIQSDLVTLNSNGAADFGLGFIVDQGTIDFGYEYNGEVRDLVFNRDELMADTVAHPLSGEMDLAVSMDIGSINGNSHTNWSMTVTFFVDHYHVYAESGDNYWEWDTYYDQGPVM